MKLVSKKQAEKRYGDFEPIAWPFSIGNSGDLRALANMLDDSARVGVPIVFVGTPARFAVWRSPQKWTSRRKTNHPARTRSRKNRQAESLQPTESK